jgi:hypothetical protein
MRTHLRIVLPGSNGQVATFSPGIFTLRDMMSSSSLAGSHQPRGASSIGMGQLWVTGHAELENADVRDDLPSCS